MYWLYVIILLLIAALLQVTVVSAVAVRGVQPDLILLVAAAIAVRERIGRGARWRAFWIGWAAGLIADVYAVGSGLPFGTTALIWGVFAAVISRLGDELFVDSCLAQVLILAPLCVVAQCVLAAAYAGLAGYPFGHVLGRAVWIGLYSGLVAPLVFAALRLVRRPFESHLRRRPRHA